MGFYQQEDEVDTGDVSKFNEAFLKMHRFHKIQDRLNSCRLNPLQQNEVLGLWNFMAMISDCDSLYLEVYGKLTEDETKEIEGIRDKIESFLLKHPIYSENTNVNGKRRLNMDMSAWNILKKEIFKYECKVRKLLNRTGYDSPNKEMFGEDEL
jgi:hypothetical protein